LGVEVRPLLGDRWNQRLRPLLGHQLALTTWTSTPNSLSKNNIQKIKDLYFILKNQKGINFTNRIYYFIKISLNSLKRKI
jgi:hypothetical protein